MQHLNEGIPNGQDQRTALAMQLLEHGCAAMKAWIDENKRRNHKSFNETEERNNETAP